MTLICHPWQPFRCTGALLWLSIVINQTKIEVPPFVLAFSPLLSMTDLSLALRFTLSAKCPIIDLYGGVILCLFSLSEIDTFLWFVGWLEPAHWPRMKRFLTFTCDWFCTTTLFPCVLKCDSVFPVIWLVLSLAFSNRFQSDLVTLTH